MVHATSSVTHTSSDPTPILYKCTPSILTVFVIQAVQWSLFFLVHTQVGTAISAKWAVQGISALSHTQQHKSLLAIGALLYYHTVATFSTLLFLVLALSVFIARKQCQYLIISASFSGPVSV